MKVIVCGGRDGHNPQDVYRTLDAFHKEHQISTVVEGDARGVDRMAGFWARKNSITNLKYPADWNRHGRAAGPIRNQKMLDEQRPDAVLAFRGGRGTADMVHRAEACGVQVVHL